jgi:hypothetical protein
VMLLKPVATSAREMRSKDCSQRSSCCSKLHTKLQQQVAAVAVAAAAECRHRCTLHDCDAGCEQTRQQQEQCGCSSTACQYVRWSHGGMARCHAKRWNAVCKCSQRSSRCSRPQRCRRSRSLHKVPYF